MSNTSKGIKLDKKEASKLRNELRDSFFLTQIKSCGIPVPKREFVFHPPCKWRFDFCWPKEKIVVEIEGGLWIQGRHNRALGMQADFEKYNQAAVDGWRLIKVTPQMINDGTAIEWVQKMFNSLE